MPIIKAPPYKRDYEKVFYMANEMYEDDKKALYRELCLSDMYFLLKYGCGLPSNIMDHPFVVHRCRVADERIASPTGLDKWMVMVFREGFKSTIFNYGAIIQKVLKYPDLSTCIFSYKKGRACDHLNAIKYTFEKSEELKDWFDDVLYENANEAPKWSQETGLIVKRQSNRREPTLMAGGIVEGQPIGMHFNFICFDDVVTKDSVKTPHMIKETTEGFELADNLGVSLEGVPSEKWIIGTFYKYGDTYWTLGEKGVYKIEKIPCVDENGDPYMHTFEQLEEKKKSQGRYVFSCQMMLDPVPPEDQCMNPKNIEYYETLPSLNQLKMTIHVDPAHTKKESRGHDPDFTAMWVMGQDRMGQRYFIDGVYDRISAPEAVDKLFELQEQYKVGWVSWEQVGAQSDTQFINRKKAELGVSFKLHAFNPRGYGAKQDRILGIMLPKIESGAIKFPKKKGFVRQDGKIIDLIDVLKQEMREFPFGHDDFLDCGTQVAEAPKYGSMNNAKAKIDPLRKPFVKNHNVSGRSIRKYM